MGVVYFLTLHISPSGDGAVTTHFCAFAHFFCINFAWPWASSDCCTKITWAWDLTVTAGSVGTDRGASFTFQSVCWQTPSCLPLLYVFAPIIVFLDTFTQQQAIPRFKYAPLWTCKLYFSDPLRKQPLPFIPMTTANVWRVEAGSRRRPIASAFHCIWLVCNGRRCHPGPDISLMYGGKQDRWAHPFPF